MSPRVVGWIVALLTSGVMLANVWFGASPLFGKAALTFALLYYAIVHGAKLARRPHGVGPSLLGLFCLLAAQSVIQTGLYYANFRLNSWTDALSLSAVIILFEVLLPAEAPRPEPGTAKERPSWLWIAGLSVPSLIALAFVLKGASGTAMDIAIRTPWPLLPEGTLAAIAVIGIATWLAAWKSRSLLFTALLASASVLAVTMIAPLLYSIGFGFDGFLHQASEKLLLLTGTLSPKPLYYIGQYVLVTWLARLTELPLGLFDRFLGPILAALLPLCALPFLKKSSSWTLPALLLFIPLSAFVATTPQSLAYLIGLAALLLALASDEIHPLAPLTLATWTLAIHPLAGLPLAAATVALLLHRSPFRWIFVLGGVAAVPAAFVLISHNANTTIAWDLGKLIDPGAWFSSALSAISPPRNRVALWADWTSIVVFVTPLLALASAMFAAWKDRDRRSTWITLIVMAVGMAATGLVLRAAGDFAFLIDYERGNYADRLFLVAGLFLLVPAAAGAGRILAAGLRGPALTAMAVLLGLTAWQGAVAYAALPRHDAAVASHGWSMGAADIEAVRWIDHAAVGEPYTVLANQNVSAAAVREFGFKRYAGEVFFYPIPTGGPLYQVYLQAVGSDPNMDAIREAAHLGQSKLVLVVLNDYWWNAQKTGETLAGIAKEEHAVRNGAVRIFKFELP